MATVYYLRKGLQAEKIASSREVSVADIINLYGPEPSNYSFIKEADSPDLSKNKASADFYSGSTGVIVRIESDEINRDTFPQGGYYVVKEATP
ncbi:MAG: hypothetical protein AMK70_10060 [Nitrospira bacterium SG8_35_1]|nr:MAG: hypothetical protein AMK70_10060 [Nitrospira bacterium SG8_35_1]